MRRSLIAGVVLVVALAACGSQAAETADKVSKVSTAELVAGAPTAAADAKTAHISGSMSIEAAGEQLEIPLEAETDFATGATQMSMDMSAMPGMPGSGKFEIRMVDGVMYMALGSLLGDRRPGPLAGKEWVEVDTAELGVTQSQLTNQNPADMLESLRGAGDVEELGSEDIDGVATRHFRAEIDTRRALDRLSDEQREEAGEFLEQMGSTFPMDVWISDDGLPRRFEMNIEIPGAGRVSMRMDFTDYGEPVEVSVPPADETISMQELQALGAS